MPNRTIGELAGEAGVGVETIRYYERIGLIPKPRQMFRGWRRYPQETLRLLQYIRQGQSLGFSLLQIADLLAKTRDGAPRFCVSFRAAVEEKIAEIDQKIAALSQHRAQLQDFVVACRQREASNQCPILESLRGTRIDHNHRED
jgi:MerR family mercuric resistance operon transcriptional regulator